MSVLHIKQIESHLKQVFRDLVDLSDYAKKNAVDRDMAFLTRSLAAFALANCCDLDAKTAASCITDGGQDNGIDAIHFDENEKILYLVQSKWKQDGRGSLERGDGQKFITGFKDIINAKFDRFNDRVRLKKPYIEKALNSGDSKFCLVLTYTGNDPLATEQQRDFTDLLEEMNDTSPILSLRVFRQVNIHGIIASGAQGSPINLEIAISNWGQTRDPYCAFYGQVAATDVASWDVHNPRLFSPNLRVFLGSTEVNQSLMDTLVHNPEKFWYFNNGITVLCSSIRKKPIGGNSKESGVFECFDVSIVNGAQTVGAIAAANVNHSSAVMKAMVPVRFISLEQCPEGFAAEVTRANNTQNRIERRDFVSLDPEQERIKTELRLDGVTYVYKSGETAPRNTPGFDLSEATIALACSRPDISFTLDAKREISKLWEDITKSPYRVLFNPGVNGKQIWRFVQIMREIDDVLASEHSSRGGREKMLPIHGNRFLAYQVFRSVDRNLLEDMDANLGDLLPQVRSRTMSLLDECMEMVDRLFPDSYLASLFKNQSKCKQLDAAMNPAGGAATRKGRKKR